MLCFPYNIYSDEIPMRLEHYFKVLPLSREAIHLSFLSSFRGPFARKEVKKKKVFFAPDSLFVFDGGNRRLEGGISRITTKREGDLA